jgi:hypothetical protein
MQQVNLEQNEDGTYTARYEWRAYRFLLNDGRTIDVRAIHDDSVLRTAVLATTKAQKIEGVAWMKDPEPDAVKVPTKRPAKTVGRQRAG